MTNWVEDTKQYGYKPESLNFIYGCRKTSDGCDHCYAERKAREYLAHHPKYINAQWSERGSDCFVDFDLTRLKKIETWRKRRFAFLASMSDICLIGRDGLNLVRYYASYYDKHIYVILTKRSRYLSEIFSNELPSNLWVGVTIENNRNIKRIEHLSEIRAKVKFLSLEPLLEPLKLYKMVSFMKEISWVIIGGESGDSARPCDPAWIQEIIEVCRGLRIPVYVKQLGDNIINYDDKLKFPKDYPFEFVASS